MFLRNPFKKLYFTLRTFLCLVSPFPVIYLLKSFLSVALGKYHSSSAATIENEDHSHRQSEEEIHEQITQQEKSAAGILCQLKARHSSQASHLTLAKDVLGIVATLGKVGDDNLSR